MHRFGLRDDQWDWIKDLLPGRPGASDRTPTIMDLLRVVPGRPVVG